MQLDIGNEPMLSQQQYMVGPNPQLQMDGASIYATLNQVKSKINLPFHILHWEMKQLDVVVSPPAFV